MFVGVAMVKGKLQLATRAFVQSYNRKPIVKIALCNFIQLVTFGRMRWLLQDVMRLQLLTPFTSNYND